MKTSKTFNGIWWNIGMLVMVAIFILSGCATKEYVGQQISPVSDRVSQTETRIGQTETRIGQTEGQISQLDKRLTTDEGKISSIEGNIGKVDAKAEKALANFGNLKLERRLVIDMKEGAKFGLNSAKLPKEAIKEIDEFLSNLKGDLASDENAVFLVAGYTDNSGSDDSNYELGKRRADSVSRYLVTEKKIDPLRVVSVSYGESSPTADNKTRDGRAKNRRVEILVYREAINTK